MVALQPVRFCAYVDAPVFAYVHDVDAAKAATLTVRRHFRLRAVRSGPWRKVMAIDIAVRAHPMCPTSNAAHVDLLASARLRAYAVVRLCIQGRGK